MAVSAVNSTLRVVGRYALYGEIASGGMATVYLGRLLGPVGFSRTVAIKCLHPQFAKDPDFMSMFLDEARLAARIQHPNAVQTLDVVATETDLFLVMEYVQGESLARLVRESNTKREPIPTAIVAAIMCGMLHGLHAVHEARDEHGVALGIVHRDISPQNVLVGVDGVPRVLDFGVAKAAGRLQTTREGQLKGKLAYMAPEQLSGSAPITRQTDIYSATVVLWEALTGQRLHDGENEAQIFGRVLQGEIPPPSHIVPDLPSSLDQVVARGANRDPNLRFASAREMALTLEACVRPATTTEVGTWVEHLAHQKLTKRAKQVTELESSSAVKVPIRLTGNAANPGYDLSVHPSMQQASPEPGPGSHPGLGSHPGINTAYAAPWGAEAASGPYLQPPPPGLSSVSQVSQVQHPQSSVSQMHMQQQTAPQSLMGIKVLVGVATAALVVATFAAVIGLRGQQARAPEAPHAVPPAVVATVPVVEPTPEQAQDVALVAPSAVVTPPVVTPPVVIPPVVTPRVAAPAITLPQQPLAAKPKPVIPKVSCDPPYTRDAAGVKTYKPECLK